MSEVGNILVKDANATNQLVATIAKTAKMTAVANGYTRPADTTAYAIGDAVANSTTAGSVTLLQWTPFRGAGVIRRVRARKSKTTDAIVLRLWLFEATLTPGAGDNAAFQGVTPFADSVGFIDIPVGEVGLNFMFGWTNVDIPYAAAALYGLLSIRSVYTPLSAETFQLDLWELPG